MPTVMTRRNFLKIAGVAAGALTLPSGLLAYGSDRSSFDFSGWPDIRLGMLMPGNSFSPRLTENFLAGFDYCLKTSGCVDAGVSVELVHGDAGGAVGVTAMKRLVNEKNVSLVTGVMNNAAASNLRAFVRDEKFVLVAGSLGECMSRKSDIDPMTFHSNLNLWQANWAMGRWAARNMGESCVVVSSLYDSGYDSLEAFRLGFTSAGGSVRGTLIPDSDPKGPDYKALFSSIAETRPDFIHVLYSGRQAAEFIKAYGSSGLAGKVPLACSSYLLTEDFLKAAGPLAAGIKTCMPWQSGLFSGTGLLAGGKDDFPGKYAAKTGRALDAFGLLGYETSGIILSALSSTRGNTKDISALARAFDGAAFVSPRGRLNMDPKTNATSGPLYIHEVGVGGGRPFTKAIAESGCPSEYDNRMRSMWAAERSGWHNAYVYA